jgi:hypothetical protein
MKSTLITALVLTSFAAFSQSTKLFFESSAGSARIASNNTLVSERYSSPMLRAAFGYDVKNLRIGVTTSNTEYGFSNSTYSVSSIGFLGGYTRDLGYLGLNADAILDYRLASLQRVGGQQITSGSLSPLDLLLRPSVFFRPIKGAGVHTVEFVVGYELGLLEMDQSDAALGISSKHRAWTAGVRMMLNQQSTNLKRAK